MESYTVTVPASKKKKLSTKKDKNAAVVCLNKIVWNDNLKTGVWPQDEEGRPDQAKGEDHSCSDAHQLSHLQNTISLFLPSIGDPLVLYRISFITWERTL
jgi:hypothetical protein